MSLRLGMLSGCRTWVRPCQALHFKALLSDASTIIPSARGFGRVRRRLGSSQAPPSPELGPNECSHVLTASGQHGKQLPREMLRAQTFPKIKHHWSGQSTLQQQKTSTVLEPSQTALGKPDIDSGRVKTRDPGSHTVFCMKASF